MQHIEETGVRKPNFDFVFNGGEERWTSDATPKTGGIFSKQPSNLKKVASQEVKNFTGDDTSDIQVGMDVEHQRFGVGKVLLLEGNGADRKALIFFQGIGQKQLLLKFARLKILS
jgi:DNA helicase-2/ATP-dependent DNA helicase PcrA